MVVGTIPAVQGDVALNNLVTLNMTFLPLTCVLSSRTSWVIVSGKDEAHQHTSVTSRGASAYSFIIK